MFDKNVCPICFAVTEKIEWQTGVRSPYKHFKYFCPDGQATGSHRYSYAWDDEVIMSFKTHFIVNNMHPDKTGGFVMDLQYQIVAQCSQGIPCLDTIKACQDFVKNLEIMK